MGSVMTPRVKYLSAGEAADLLSVSRRTISRWCEDGLLEARRTAGGHWRIRPASVEDLSRTTKGVTDGKRS